VEIVDASPDTPEARTLRKAAKSIWTDTSELVETTIYSLDRRSLAIVRALADDRVPGRYSEQEWRAGLKRLRV